jgi:Cytidylyltransferase family
VLTDLGFVFFVGSLQKGHYRFQFQQFAWTHIALYLIVVQAHFVMNNIFEGMIWFLLPAALVIINDIMAYVCGITFGRTQLIKLSPKKTVEGFVGAWIFTVIFGYVLANSLIKYTYFTCPVNVSTTSSKSYRSNLISRTLARISSQVSIARPTPYTLSNATGFPLKPHHGPVFPIVSSLNPFNSTSSSSQPLHLSSRHSVASLPQESSEHSTLRISVTQSPAMEASLIDLTVNLSWALSHTCTTKVSLLYIMPLSEALSKWLLRV